MTIFFDIETTGLNPYEDVILTIQFKLGEEITIWKLWDTDEPTMLLSFIDYLRSISGDDTIYGYNCLKFDIPFIVARMNHHGLMNAETYRLIHDKKWFDLYQFQGDNYVSMDRWLDSFGIERSCHYSGRDVPYLHQQGKYKDIEEHALDDLIVCEKLVNKLMKN
jgi:uncharacterized protein YprB with RNaseH-like and TPR domain